MGDKILGFYSDCIIMIQKYYSIILYFFYRIYAMDKQVDQLKVYADSKLKLKYEILNKLGEGCFGIIYKAINRSSKRQVALKFQFHDPSTDIQLKKSSIANQMAILEKLKGVPGVPKLYAAGKWNHGYYIEIQLLSSSLYDEKNKQFTQQEIYSITSELIQILKNVHKKGVIHQDLKPQNIMRNQKGSFYIIDFGLSASTNLKSSQKQDKKRGFVGTPRYASLAAHHGLRQGPKDDLQSLLYVMGSMYMKRAPWFQLKGPAAKRLQKIQKVKQTNSMLWFKQCGYPFALSYQYLIELGSAQQLNYSYIANLFQNCRKATTIKALKSPSSLNEANRRRSDINGEILKIPTINIHLVGLNNQNKIQKVKTMAFDGDNSQISVSHTNFSQMAQDGYLELLQILTEKIFNTVDQKEKRDSQESAMINSMNCKEPLINNISKYEGLHFKNPFKT